MTLFEVKGREESEEKSALDSDSLKPETFCMECLTYSALSGTAVNGYIHITQ
jgi:hypothetical protein